MSKTARQPATGYRPSGRQCVECKRAAEDCSGIDFAAMPQAGKRDADGVQRVACSYYVRAGEARQHPNSTGHAHAGAMLLQILGSALESADRREHPCCGALASGPHKMGCDYKLSGVQAQEEHWCELCGDSLTTLKHDEAIGYYRDCAHCGSQYQGKEERAMSPKPCRCGPDGCADSVACPRRSA